MYSAGNPPNWRAMPLLLRFQVYDPLRYPTATRFHSPEFSFKLPLVNFQIKQSAFFF
jgi:hypothetical protein